jgi:hypothetical protein
MESTSQTFPCPQCGKKLKWKPAIAGKVGKCGCGAKVRAPEMLDEPDDVSLLYDLAGPDKQPDEPPVAAIAPPVVSVEYATGRTQADTDESSIDSADLLHEVYLPLAVLLAGFVAILVWTAVIHPSRHEAFSLAFMSAFNCITLFIKTVAISLLIWYIAKRNDGSLGNPITLVLKIASLIIFLDAAETWIREILKATGAITPAGKGPLAVIGCSLLVSFVIAVLISQFVYRLEGPAAKIFGRVIAVGNWAMNWIFIFLLGILATSLTHAAARARAAAAAPPQNFLPAIQTSPTISSGTPLTVQQGQTAPTAMDEQISQEIKQNPFRFQEGYAWCRSGAADDADKKLINDMYVAGADKVYMGGFTMYAQLPADPAKREACLDVAHEFRTGNGIPDDAATNSLNSQYVVINLLGEQLKRLHHGN